MRPTHEHGETPLSHRFDFEMHDALLGADVHRCARCELFTFARPSGVGQAAARAFAVEPEEPRRWLFVSIRLPCRAGAWS